MTREERKGDPVYLLLKEILVDMIKEGELTIKTTLSSASSYCNDGIVVVKNKIELNVEDYDGIVRTMTLAENITNCRMYVDGGHGTCMDNKLVHIERGDVKVESLD